MDQRQSDLRQNETGPGAGFGAAQVEVENGAGRNVPVVRKVEFSPLPDPVRGQAGRGPTAHFFGIALKLSAELGKITIPVRELINLEIGSTLKLKRVADERVLILLNETPFARGEVVVINERFGIRVTALLDDEAAMLTGPNQGGEG